MTSTDHYDGIVIGAGQAGSPLSVCLATEGGWKTALIERAHVGGTCINEGCTPTKTMVASARVAHMARRAADYGVETGPVTVNLRQVRRRKREVVEGWRKGSLRRLQQAEGLDLVMGEAGFTGPNTLEVRLNDGGRRRLSADKVFINTGNRPAIPSIAGLDLVPALDSSSIMELDTVPQHLLIVGGGYIGLEFGQMFRRFGSAVTIIQRAGQLLAREDPDVAGELAEILREDGVEVLLGSQVLRAEPDADGGVRVTASTPEGERALRGSHLLVAAGRVPNTDLLSLAAAGVETDDRGYIKVNDRLETNVPGVYALGDVKGGPAFTHISYDDFRIIRTNLVRGGHGGHTSITGRFVPYTVFTDPQLGRVGLTEREARDRGHNVRVAKLPMRHVARAAEMDETRGFMKAVVDADTDQVLGCAILGVEGGEIMGVLQMAMRGKVPCATIQDEIFSHPTLSEALNNLFQAWEQTPP